MEISDIKANLKIETVLSHYGLQPDKNGMIKCPFHDDKTPSMQVYTSTLHAIPQQNCSNIGQFLK